MCGGEVGEGGNVGVGGGRETKLQQLNSAMR